MTNRDGSPPGNVAHRVVRSAAGRTWRHVIGLGGPGAVPTGSCQLICLPWPLEVAANPT